MWEYFYGAMATRTGMTQVFELTWLPDRGIVLRLPAANHPEKAAPYVHRAGHLAVFDQSTRWCALLGVNNAADVAEMMEGHRFRHFIRLNEALHDKAIADIAADIAIQHKKIVLVAGPSSSGKTTFAQRLALHLNVIGLQPLVISLDNYYLDRDSIPLQEDGTLDLEAISTLDVPLFRQHLAELLDGREVLLPTFSFKLGKRNPAYLSADERQAALVLSRSLKIGKQLVEDGEKSAKAIKDAITAEINKEPLARIDYVDVVDFETITPVDEIKGTTLVAIAVYIGKTRLIDNFIA